MKRLLLLFILAINSYSFIQVNAQESIARKWNTVMLEGIRNDFARPTVHARNLFHSSILMYDVWATLHPEADTYMAGKNTE